MVICMEYEFDLGGFHMPVTTSVAAAQAWFNRGMAWTYGFNHEEAVACFRRAVEADPGCAMAHWGIAYAIGPNYNKQWEAFDDIEATESLATAFDETRIATGLAGECTPVEANLIEAIAARYPVGEPVEDMLPWNDDYADAMRNVYRANPGNADVEALFAEAMMNRTPWALWDLTTGEIPEGADTLETRQVLERAINRLADSGERPHPGLLHMYIHLMEMSPTPEAAMKAADSLRGLVPDSGHLEHMPSHIDVLCGDYASSVRSNEDAIIADRRFLKKEGAQNFYTLYRSHNTHFKAYSAMLLGQYRPAVHAAEELVSTLPEELLRVESPPMADWLEAFIPIKQHVLIRFGKWEEILAQEFPEDRQLYCVTCATMRYARAVAHASLMNPQDARTEAKAFEAAVEQVPDSRYLFNNSCLDILAIAREMMMGEILYREDRFDEAFAHLRQAVKLDDSMPYDEPWGWMQPARHALGALLLEQGHVEEACEAYRADLGLSKITKVNCPHPDNVWSLVGYHECLERLGMNETAAQIRQRLNLARARADVPVDASCFCRLSALAA